MLTLPLGSIAEGHDAATYCSRKMSRKIERDEVHADVATVEALLGAVPDGDVLGRRSLTARRETVVQELATLTAQAQPSARAENYLGEAPVVGSRGTDDLDHR